ncbi:MAG: DNA-protecting protein DprA [Erysipelotrichaceae bacterium]|nr:DNA-protecting protein DprA [Erysipelotrichaceae bacterium]MCI9313214.1 DNA-protecting protein DprA [Erysipelotrichaceae bacterium]
MREQILSYALKYQGEWQRIAQAIGEQEAWQRSSYSGQYVTIVDEAYPERLKFLRYPPWILFYEGNYTLLQNKGVAVVGSRRYNGYGAQMCRHVCALLKTRGVIISGLARGIDAIAHREAMDCHTIAIIGCGLDVLYPRENYALYEQMKQSQLILSEYPNGSPPQAHHFPWRNRLIAALAQAVVVIQAKKHSGTMITVNEAITLGLPIYCVPYAFQDPYGEGCNLLIAQGANLLVDDRDILAIL